MLAEHGDAVNALAFSPDGRLVATAAGSPPPDTRDTTIKIWRVGSAASVLTLPGHDRGTTGVAFSADGSTLISSGRDGVLRRWRVSDGARIGATATGSPNGPLAISPQRKMVAVPGANSSILLFTADGVPLLSTPRTNAAPSSLSFSGDGGLLAVGEGAYGNNVQIFDTTDGTLARTLAGDPHGFVQGVAFAPTGTTLLSGSGFSHVIQVWNAGTGALLASYDQETGWGPFPQLPLAFSPAASEFGYGRGDGPVVVAKISP
jgi:WD40 repeat protein